MTDQTKRITSFFSESLTLRMLMIGVLVILMMIPLSMVKNVIQERNSYYYESLENITSTWGGSQTLVGPVLVIPYVDHLISMDTVTDKNGETKTVTRDVFSDKTAIILPSDLKIDVDLKEEYRYRGIYETLVYTGNLTLSGLFDHSMLTNESAKRRRYEWDKARLMIGLTDTKAITRASDLRWNENSIPLQPGTRMTDMLRHGFSASLKAAGLDDLQTENQFVLQLSFRGSEGFRFAPLGENTLVHVTSTWPHPSFQGDALPDERETDDNGFSAKWNIPHLARSYPQKWVVEDENYSLNSFTAGVNLFEPVSLYSKTLRSVKYGIMFVAMTFLTFLIFELTIKRRMHLVQYIVIGVALSLFYLTLLSLAEHVAFIYAYILASAITVAMITLYSLALLKTYKRALLIFFLLSALYAVLYSLLQLEDYALLLGTALLLLATAAVMYVTRQIQDEAEPIEDLSDDDSNQVMMIDESDNNAVSPILNQEEEGEQVVTSERDNESVSELEDRDNINESNNESSEQDTIETNTESVEEEVGDQTDSNKKETKE